MTGVKPHAGQDHDGHVFLEIGPLVGVAVGSLHTSAECACCDLAAAQADCPHKTAPSLACATGRRQEFKYRGSRPSVAVDCRML
eukprot:4919467-Amphidinium_carterae.1